MFVITIDGLTPQPLELRRESPLPAGAMLFLKMHLSIVMLPITYTVPPCHADAPPAVLLLKLLDVRKHLESQPHKNVEPYLAVF